MMFPDSLASGWKDLTKHICLAPGSRVRRLKEAVRASAFRRPYYSYIWSAPRKERLIRRRDTRTMSAAKPKKHSITGVEVRTSPTGPRPSLSACTEPNPKRTSSCTQSLTHGRVHTEAVFSVVERGELRG